MEHVSTIPPTTALFAAFLGYNPMETLLSQLPANDIASISNSTISTLESSNWFPNAIASSFQGALATAFYVGAILSVIAGAVSLFRGRRYIYTAGQELSDERRISTMEMKLDTARGRRGKRRGTG